MARSEGRGGWGEDGLKRDSTSGPGRPGGLSGRSREKRGQIYLLEERLPAPSPPFPRCDVAQVTR